jgi:hypothetical protein
MSGNYLDLMLDSGAFTVWRQGEKIDLGAYIRFILENEHLLSSYVNLDVMPGQPGAARTPTQTEHAAEAGWVNYLQMREAGLEPIHVFHMGERWCWLEKMLDEGCSHIGLSANITLPTPQKRVWLDECFGLLCGSNGYPEVKVHGFGITSVPLMLRYPWTSTDSVTWFKQAVNGSIYVPRSKLGMICNCGSQEHMDPTCGPPIEEQVYDYDVAPYSIGIIRGGKSGPSAQALGDQTHLQNCGGSMRRYVLGYIADNDMKVADLEADYEQRIRLNARFFKQVTKQHRPVPFYQSRAGLFATRSSRGQRKPVAPFRLVLSIGTYLEYANILREEGYPWQLISYHRILTGPTFDLESYAKTGWFIRNSMKGRKDPRSGGRCGGPLKLPASGR